MKKLIAVILALICVFGLFGCNADEVVPDVSDSTGAKISPLPTTLDVENLEDATVAVSLEKGDFYADENGNLMMNVTVFTYDLYDMVDIGMMKEGDTFVSGQNEILISSVERDESGLVLINGGLDNGGIELKTDDATVYYETGYSNVKSFYELGKVSLPVSADFVYSDTSDLNNDAITMNAEEFMNADIDYNFTADNTTIQIAGGFVTALTRVYMS